MAGGGVSLHYSHTHCSCHVVTGGERAGGWRRGLPPLLTHTAAALLQLHTRYSPYTRYNPCRTKSLIIAVSDFGPYCIFLLYNVIRSFHKSCSLALQSFLCCTVRLCSSGKSFAAAVSKEMEELTAIFPITFKRCVILIIYNRHKNH